MKLGLPIGLSILTWSILGFIRFISDEISSRKKDKVNIVPFSKLNVAACIPAHNEEVGIAKTIGSINRNLPKKNIYVVSDGSTDKTAQIAKKQGCKVLALKYSKGKSKALNALIKRFGLLNKYDFIIIVDADTMINSHYVSRALSLFSREKDTVAIAAYALPFWRNHRRISRVDFIAAYRTRLYRMLQWVLMYGQTWKLTNVNPVIPGFAAIYRTSVLKHLQLDVPGIWIEDFSLAFQIHKNKLGKIGHQPNILAVYGDPHTITDYFKQVRRWNVGFYQTVRHYGVWPSLFWVSLGLFTFENIIFSLFTLILPILVLLLTTQYYAPIINPDIVRFSNFVSGNYAELWEIFLVFFLIDYTITVFVALKDRKYMLLFYGFGFFFFQYINSLILLASLPKGLFGKSSGKWTPAKRN